MDVRDKELLLQVRQEPPKTDGGGFGKGKGANGGADGKGKGYGRLPSSQLALEDKKRKRGKPGNGGGKAWVRKA